MCFPFFLDADEWSYSRAAQKAQANVPAQNKGTCNTYVGIVALLVILVKDRIRVLLIRRNTWNNPGLLPSDLLHCWTKNKFKRKRTLLCIGNASCNQTPAGLRWWTWVRDVDHNHLQLLWRLTMTKWLTSHVLSFWGFSCNWRLEMMMLPQRATSSLFLCFSKLICSVNVPAISIGCSISSTLLCQITLCYHCVSLNGCHVPIQKWLPICSQVVPEASTA